MSKRVWKIVGWLAAISLALSIGGLAGGAIAYAITRVREPVSSATEELGVLVASVVPGGPAEIAGVVRGDILLEVDKVAVDHVGDLMRFLEGRDPGDDVQLTVLHGDSEITLTATLGDRDGVPYLGLQSCRGVDMVDDLRKEDLEPILEWGARIVDVMAGSPAEAADLRAGDVILAVDDAKLDAETDLADLVLAHKPGDGVVLQVERFGMDTRNVAVELGENADQQGIAYLGVRYLRLPAVRASWPRGLRLERLVPEGMPHGLELDGLFSQDALRQGAFIQRVLTDSPAAEADLRLGDIITAIDGESVHSARALSVDIAERDPGDRVKLSVVRSGESEVLELAVTLGEHPEDEGVAYLGVELGGFISRRRFGSDDGKNLRDELELFFDFNCDRSAGECFPPRNGMLREFGFRFPDQRLPDAGTGEWRGTDL
jgi:S1-C subfamily serine protease